MTNIFLGMNIITLLILILLIGIGLDDLYRYFKGKKTYSQKVHAWFGGFGDGLILCGIMGTVWWLLGPNFFITVLCGVILGHLFWYYEK
jgi:hypothetical protein